LPRGNSPRRAVVFREHALAQKSSNLYLVADRAVAVTAAIVQWPLVPSGMQGCFVGLTSLQPSDYAQDVPPRRGDGGECDQDDSIEPRHARPGDRALKDGELVAEQGVLYE
jgi:hypothetical protein